MFITRATLLKWCKDAAFQHNIGPDGGTLLLAMVVQESSCDPTARRLEQNFFRKYVKSHIDVHPVDQVLLSASWGLMQTMGEALYRMGYFVGKEREAGFIHARLMEYLNNPESQIEYGARWLGVKIKATGSLDRGIIAYNGSPDYLAIIQGHIRRLKAEGYV
jgi:hypothetical protein